MEARRLKQLTLFGIFLLLAISMHTHADNPDSPDDPELKIRSHLTEGNSTNSRVKRQYGCPSGCFSSCSNNQQCQRYQVATVCMLGCCCPQTNLSSACDGDPAVAACLNGLCGQGYFCNNRNFCCRCQSGTSPGPCVNNLCPAGYACNTNNFCCSLGSGSVLGPCINGQCPAGYACGAGNLRKRQIIQQPCSSPCFQCSPALQCQNTYRQFTCNNICCCPAAPTLTGACDGEDSVAACLNGLCGQGFFCSKTNYCCRCPVGQSIGKCVNGKCPSSTNDYCCAIGMIGVMGPCINGQCPAGYTCGQGNICYSGGTGTTNNAFNGTTNTVNRFAPVVSRTINLPSKSKQPSSLGLSSFQQASLESSNSGPNFGSNFGSAMHSYLPASNPYIQPSIDTSYVQPSIYSNGFGSSPQINFLQQQAINNAFQSHMMNPFLFNQETAYGTPVYGGGTPSGYGAKKHKN
ncbi:hypothetical protein M3Y97_00044400 [Aphelenchoides bicaudatus]|nr:hypothetical protein M3Y97_00044400 [Aphelenchoides bicaudatus]